MIDVKMVEGRAHLHAPYNELDVIKCRGIPDARWSKRAKVWVCAPTRTNFDYMKAAWGEQIRFDKACTQKMIEAQAKLDMRTDVLTKKRGPIDTSLLTYVPFKMPPREHQKIALLLARDLPYFAYLMDQGTGKTKTLIDDAAHQFRMKRIEVLLVIAPNSVKDNWVNYTDEDDQIRKHMPPDVPYVAAQWVSNPNADEKKRWAQFEKDVFTHRGKKLIVLVVNIEALIVDRIFDYLMKFVETFKTMIAIDESTRIKTISAKRTKAAFKIRKPCPVARIMSGTPIIKSPLDAFAQFGFLDPDILGYGSFYAFRNRYAVMGGFEQRQVIMYKNMDELSEKIASISYRVTKEECLDLPPQTWQKRRITMTKEQMRCYNDMREKLLVEFKTTKVRAEIALTQLMRFQEITGGYLPQIDEETGETVGHVEIVKPQHNPKFQEAISLIEESGDQQIIVWSRFKAEIAGFRSLLEKEGIKYLEFHGDIKPRDRTENKNKFQRDKSYKVLLGNPQAGGIGIDLFAASVVIYLSNSFDTEQRVQSEDRAHRIGTTLPVTYYDLICPATVDVHIVGTLRRNKKISDEVMKDGISSWL